MIGPRGPSVKPPLDIRAFRSCSEKQSEFLDACFSPTTVPGVVNRYVLGGGAGFGGKSYTIRTGVLEAAIRLAQAGVKSPRQQVYCYTMGDVEARFLKEAPRDRNFYTREPNGLNLFGVFKGTKAGHFEFTFDDPALGVVEFRHAQQLDRQRGQNVECVWVDELTQFPVDDWASFTYIARSSQSPPFILIGAATNPDGPGNYWVKDLWVDKTFQEFPGADRRLYRFIQFFASDNPACDESAMAMLQALPEEKRRARLLGEWDVLTTTRFRYNALLHRFTWPEFIKHFDPGAVLTLQSILQNPRLINLFGCFDFGTSLHGGSNYQIMGRTYGGYFWTLAELQMKGMGVRHQSNLIKEFEEGYFGFPVNVPVRYCDPALRGNVDASGHILSAHRAFEDNGVFFELADNSRVAGWDAMEYLLEYDTNDVGEIVTVPLWRIHEACTGLHDFLRNAPRSATNPQDVDPKFKADHAGDAARYGVIENVPRAMDEHPKLSFAQVAEITRYEQASTP